MLCLISEAARALGVALSSDRGSDGAASGIRVSWLIWHIEHLAQWYVALGVERELCLTKVVGYGADGEVAFEDPYKKCHPIPLDNSVIQARLHRSGH
jgi:hypothetical protein